MSNDVNFDLLWCEECGKSLPGECQIHGTLLKVKDKVIPSRARLTLPHYLQLRELEIRPGNKQLLGVFAKKVIQKRTQFGPFEATLVTSIANLTNRDENKFLLQVFKNGKEYYLDTPNEDVCNWMMFVRPARNHAEQNMVAYQYRDKIYFSSTKPIEPHCELKVWYAADYAKRMNMQVLVKEEDELSCALQNKPQEIRPVSTLDFFKTENHTEPWKCSNCNNVFSTFALLEEHSCSAAVTVAAPPTTKTPKKKGRKVKKRNAEGAKARLASKLGDKRREGVLKKVKRRIRELKPRKTYPCNACGKVFINLEKLKIHTYTHTGERPFKCSSDGCDKAFVSKYKLLRHMTTHSPHKTHKCAYCEKMFHRKDHLKNHLQTHDPNKEAFKCEECGKEYNTKLGFRRHMALHSAAAGDLTCRVCSAMYESTEALLEHLKVHSGKPAGGMKEKKHKCDHCDRRFYTRKDVRRHLVVHTGRKDFLCQFCAQRFGRKDHLTRHTKKSHCAEFLKIKESPDGSTSSQLLSPMEAPDLNFGSLPRDDSLPKLTINKGRPLTKAETKAFTNKLEPPPKVAMEISIETSNTNQDDGPMGLKLPGPAVITEPVNASTVDLGQLLGFLPLNSALNASIPISQPQTSLQGMNIPMTMSMTPQSTSSRISVQNHMTMSPTASLTSQIPFVPLSQSLPRFHQAFQ
ncbi:zinc finger protein PLAG1-like isoform X1 [Branchiostoma lanceolatum]|uniref:zinc finger protein PLAG1-like isoform X1 n=1 Tax=Branchiostoma lanceolatum TaxID=7740 RepID=UPI00345670C6